MKMRNYLKKKIEEADVAVMEAVKSAFWAANKKKIILSVGALIALMPILFVFAAHRSLNNVAPVDEELVQLTSSPIAETSGKKGIISIPSGTAKANPFVPYRDISGTSLSVSDVPAFNLVEPPEMINEASDAARIMDTIVSGILYDKYSPSAILNIEGNDYLVKKGDVVNNYKVVNIAQDSVTVKLGANVYKAGIGEILTEGSMNHNEVANLSKKFGGEK